MFVNLAFYKFVDLADLLALNTRVAETCLKLGVKGTILLAEEGLNCFVAGSREAIDELKPFMIAQLGTAELPFKESLSDEQPFNRMLVKIKKEIITMGRPEIRPSRSTGKRVAPRELKQWLDEGREVVLLDTRNDYEVRLGTFEGAIDLGLKTFRQFPKSADALPVELKGKTVVSFCTGGIRCEKASALLANDGFNDVYQLDGGILRYFEEVGETYFKGECFVFDYRVALDTELKETETVLCYNCQNPVTADEQRSPLYVYEVSCPHCINGKAHKEKIAERIKGLAE